MTLADRIGLGVALALLAVTLSLRACPDHASTAAAIPDPLPALDRIEERLVAARAIQAHWRAYATHTQPQLTHCTDAALTRRPR